MDVSEMTSDDESMYSSAMSTCSNTTESTTKSTSNGTNGSHSSSEDKRRSCTGVPIREVKKRILDAELRHRSHVTSLNSRLRKMDCLDANFIVIKFSLLVSVNKALYLPAEVGITAFNIRKGIVANFSALIDVYKVPEGFGMTARANRVKLGVPYPPFDNRCQDYEDIARRMEEFVVKNIHPKNITETLKIYCMPQDMKETEGCLSWLYSQFSDQGHPFDIFSFCETMRIATAVAVEQYANPQVKEVAFSAATSTPARSHLVSTLDPSEPLPRLFIHDRQVEEYLASFDLAFEHELGCTFHSAADPYTTPECPLNFTNRYAYNMLDSFLRLNKDLDAKPGFHFPGISIFRSRLNREELRNPKAELERREQLLEASGCGEIKGPQDFKLDPKIPPKHFKVEVGSRVRPDPRQPSA